jgi:hypothetical protein
MFRNRVLPLFVAGASIGGLVSCSSGARCRPCPPCPTVAEAPCPDPCAPPDAAEAAHPDTAEPCGVRAKRYRTCVVEGGWEARRAGGAGRTIEELWFPEEGVVANLEYELVREGERETWKPVLNAFRGEVRNEYGPWCGPDAAPSPLEDVEVPAALAKAIFEAADLRGRVDDARRTGGARLSASGILREVPAAAAKTCTGGRPASGATTSVSPAPAPSVAAPSAERLPAAR